MTREELYDKVYNSFTNAYQDALDYAKENMESLDLIQLGGFGIVIRSANEEHASIKRGSPIYFSLMESIGLVFDPEYAAQLARNPEVANNFMRLEQIRIRTIGT